VFLRAWVAVDLPRLYNPVTNLLEPFKPSNTPSNTQTTLQVFLRAWVAVDLPRLYNPVTNLLGPAPAAPDFPRARKEQEVRPPGQFSVYMHANNSTPSTQLWCRLVHSSAGVRHGEHTQSGTEAGWLKRLSSSLSITGGHLNRLVVGQLQSIYASFMPWHEDGRAASGWQACHTAFTASAFNSPFLNKCCLMVCRWTRMRMPT
jgi:hypothetical protein